MESTQSYMLCYLNVGLSKFLRPLFHTSSLFSCLSSAPSAWGDGERAVAASVAIDWQGMIGEGHVGFARDELGCMFDSVCTT